MKRTISKKRLFKNFGILISGLFKQPFNIFFPFSFVAILFFASCGNKTKSEKTDFSKAQGVVDSIELLTNQIKKDSSDYKLWEERAALYLKKGNVDASFRDLNSALDLNSKDPQLYILLADVYFAIGQKKSSLSSIKKAIDLDPDNPDYYLKMAKFKLMLGNSESAEAFADKVLTLSPENSQAFYIKAVSNLELKDTANALKMILVAANIDTNFFAANLNAAVLLDYKKDSLAEVYYKRALRVKPDNLVTEYSLAMFYQRQGKFEKALETYKSVTSKHPSHSQSYYNEGYIYLTEYLDFDKAAGMFNKAIEIEPDFTEAVYNLGRTYEAMKDTAKAKEKYREALKLTTNYELAIEGLNRLEK